MCYISSYLITYSELFIYVSLTDLPKLPEIYLCKQTHIERDLSVYSGYTNLQRINYFHSYMVDIFAKISPLGPMIANNSPPLAEPKTFFRISF